MAMHWEYNYPDETHMSEYVLDLPYPGFSKTNTMISYGYIPEFTYERHSLGAEPQYEVARQIYAYLVAK
jgi:hypothetical protein